MQRLLSLVLCAAAATAFAPPALSSDDAAKSKGVDASVAQPLKADPKDRVPAQRKDPEARDPEARGSASAGSSAQDGASGGTDLGVQADKEDEERRKEERMQRRK
jgi:hypothetical protein